MKRRILSFLKNTGSPPVFDFSSYPGYKAQYKGDDINNSGTLNEESAASVVATWSDVSGNGYDLPSTGSPTVTTHNGLNCVAIDGTQYFHALTALGAISADQNHTIYVVCQQDSDGTTGGGRTVVALGRNLTSRDATGISMETSSSDYIRIFGGNVQYPNSGLIAKSLVLHFGGVGTSRRYFLDDVEQTEISGSNQTLAHAFTHSDFFIGTLSQAAGTGPSTSSNAPFHGKIMEVVVYFAAHSNIQVSEINTELMTKWAL